MEHATEETRPSPRDDEEPKFLPRKHVLSRESYVLVKWKDGRQMKVGRFCRRADAVRWILDKSADWLLQYQSGEISN